MAQESDEAQGCVPENRLDSGKSVQKGELALELLSSGVCVQAKPELVPSDAYVQKIAAEKVKDAETFGVTIGNHGFLLPSIYRDLPPVYYEARGKLSAR